MIIFPAVDLQNGKAVRLRQGRADDSTIFSDDPAAMAEQWQDAGAAWLHVVDLDGAFAGESRNVAQVAEICRRLSIPVQLGGGIRDMDAAARWFDAGVTRIIIGTMALESPDTFAALCARFPGKVGVSLDADQGRLKTRGWVKDAGLTVDDALPGLCAAGAAFIIYTDIARDGMHSGVNLPALAHLAETSPAPVIAAGGVSTLADIQALYPLSRRANLEGAITGRAIYEGTLSLSEAVAWLKQQITEQA